MRASELEIIEQAKFCKVLASKLLESIKEDIKPFCIREDVKRLRRELSELSHMTEWEWGKNDRKHNS